MSTRSLPSSAKVAGRQAVLARYSGFAGLAVGASMSAIDGSIVNSMLPIITNALDSDVATIEWVVTTYLLIQSGLLLSFGRLGDLRGHKLVFVCGFVVYITGAVLSGLAPSPAFLIGSRAIQALGASAL